MRFFDIPLLAASLPVLSCSGYLLTLTMLSARANPPPYAEPRLRFDIVVPAHNEELGIGGTVANLRELDYPKEFVRVLVVADNCTDATAERARAAGARVLVRDDATKRGKGYALEYAFGLLVEEAVADVIVVVDADSQVSANFLRAFGARFERGAPAVQARYGVRNRDDSWRTRLMSIAFATFHDSEVAWTRTTRIILWSSRQWNGFSSRRASRGPTRCVLGRGGRRVRRDSRQAGTSRLVRGRGQRGRRHGGFGGSVEVAATALGGGRWNLAKKHGIGLFREAVRKRDCVLFDMALDLVIPPLSTIALASLAGTLASGVAVATGTASPVVLVPWGASMLMLGAYVARGVVLSGTGVRGFVDLAAAPAYVAWKMALRRREPRTNEWVRTTRGAEECA